MATATAKTLSEITQATQPLRVDREAGIIRGVKIIGTESRNGRRYPKPVLLAAVSKYEGRKAYINHPAKGAETIERRYEDWAGKYQNVRGETVHGDFGLYGDLALRRGSAHFESLLSDAEDPNFASDFGISHVAVCESDYADGVEVVSEIVEVLSGDIVTDPATNAGLFESKESNMATEAKPKTRKRSLAEIRGLQPKDSLGAKLLMEMDEGMAEMQVETPAESTPEDDASAAMGMLIMAVVNDKSLDLAAKKSKIGKLLQLTEDEPAKPAPSEGEGETPAPTEESKKLADAMAKLARMEAKTLLLESGREATEIRVRTLASASEADRKALVESWPKLASAAATGSLFTESSPGAIRYGDDLDDVSDDDAAAYEKRLLEAAGR
jgi:hypothetical protein